MQDARSARRLGRSRKLQERRFRSLLAEALEPRCVLSATIFEYGSVGYFLRTDVPRLERYDIQNESWLMPVSLPTAPGTPTAAHADADGLYVAYGKAVYRFSPNGSGQTHVLNANDNVIAIHSDGNLLFLNHTSGLYARFISINKSTNAVIDTIENYVDSV